VAREDRRWTGVHSTHHTHPFGIFPTHLLPLNLELLPAIVTAGLHRHVHAAATVSRNGMAQTNLDSLACMLKNDKSPCCHLLPVHRLVPPHPVPHHACFYKVARPPATTPACAFWFFVASECQKRNGLYASKVARRRADARAAADSNSKAAAVRSVKPLKTER
jgi:hypothetical protein